MGKRRESNNCKSDTKVMHGFEEALLFNKSNALKSLGAHHRFFLLFLQLLKIIDKDWYFNFLVGKY